MLSADLKIAALPSRWFASRRKRNLVLSLSLILLTLMVFQPVSNNAFINFDDTHYITANSHVISGLNWGSVKWAFTTYEAANWHPLTWLSHELDCQLFGLNPAGHHFTSVLLHAMNAVLLFLLLEGMTGFIWRSFVAAAVFAVHPLTVESVAWAAERKNVLSMFFFLLAVGGYVWYCRNPKLTRYLALLVLFLLALMAKPQVVTFPFILLVLDYWPLRRVKCEGTFTPYSQKSIPGLLIEKMPLFLLSGISAMLTVHAQRAGEAVRTVSEYPIFSRLENAVLSYALYLRDAIFPYHLAPIYPHPANSLCFNCSLAGWKLSLAGLVLIAISVLSGIMRSKAYLVVGWLWFLGTLVPMIGIIQVGTQARADRYMYLPMVGLLAMVVWGLAEIISSRKTQAIWSTIVVVVVLSTFSFATRRQLARWRNSETLWTYTLQVTDRNFMAEDNLAQELAYQGRTTEAMIHFHNTLNLYNWGPLDLIRFGVYEQRHGYIADSIKQYERALQNTTDLNTRAIELSNMGSAYMDLRDIDQAEQRFEKALQADPQNVAALIGTGLIAQKKGELDVAIRQYSKAVSTAPTDLSYALLGRAFEESGRPADANLAYGQARRLTQDFEHTRSVMEYLLEH